MPIRASDLNTWVGLNVRQFCFEGVPARFRETARRNARNAHRSRRPPPTLSTDRHYVYRRDPENHCAHFVSHALGMGPAQFGGAAYAHLRVSDIAAICPHPSRVELDGRDLQSSPIIHQGLIFVIAPGLATIPQGHLQILSGENRHVGFYIDGRVWHYENNENFERVVAYPLWSSMMCFSGESISRFHDRYGPDSEHYLTGLPAPIRGPRDFVASSRTYALPSTTRSQPRRR